jgi:hypothetical protein
MSGLKYVLSCRMHSVWRSGPASPFALVRIAVQYKEERLIQAITVMIAPNVKLGLHYWGYDNKIRVFFKYV